jgi:hypothetical protein
MDIEYINKNFPAIELSYDNINHKKVPNLYLAIPYGKKYCIWYTHYNGEDICYLIEYNIKTHKIIHFKRICSFFEKSLSYGTVLYGTLVNKNKGEFFVCENIFYFEGRNVCNRPYKYILNLMNTLFVDNKIKQIAYTGNEVIVTLCIMNKIKEGLLETVHDQTYDIYGILSRNIHNTYSFLVPQKSIRSSNKTFTFRVMADIKYNVYNLYCYGKNGIQFYQKTYIPDYKTSVMLNDKYRIIKENSNLDLLEESDDEEEFQNIDEDKFVHLDRYYNFKCTFHNKIKRWIPLEITNDRRIVNYSELKY